MKARWLILSLGMCVALGASLTAMAGPAPGGLDSDADGVEDAFDNCVNAANPLQGDVDHDGCGGHCDPDANNDGTTNIGDFLLLQPCFGQPTACQPSTDFNEDGVINIGDFLILQPKFGTTPGAGVSGLPATHKNPALCL